MDNPFERYDLDPRDGVAAITARLKELAEDATSDAEREQIRAAWELLTVHPERRLLAAIGAHPETRPPLGAPPSGARERSGPVAIEPLELLELLARPSVKAALSPSLLDAVRAAQEAREAVDGAAPSLDDDPHF